MEDRRPEETTAGTEEHQADVNSLPPFHGLGRSQPRCLSFSEPDPKEPGLDKDLSAILSPLSTDKTSPEDLYVRTIKIATRSLNLQYSVVYVILCICIWYYYELEKKKAFDKIESWGPLEV